MSKICVITGTRAEYGLLFYLLRRLDASDRFTLQLIVTGSHLSPEFGLTHQIIEQDGFCIDKKVEILLSSDSDFGVAKSMGLGMIGFEDAFSELKPDLLICLGDRYEMFVAASVATVMKIPIAHIHGGETTEGAYDESFRHSISKMAYWHFTSTEVYRNRVIQLGEHPDRVFNVGGIGLDNINRLELLSRDDFQSAIKLQLNKKNLLVTYHPETLSNDKSTCEKFKSLLEVLRKLTDTSIIFTKANADAGGRVINSMIDTYVTNHASTSISFVSMGQLRYLSAMRYVDGVVGNSSSGLLEAPSFNIGTINIGNRQKGRVMADSIINCDATVASISSAIDKLYSEKFQNKLKDVTNPHGEGGATKKIIDMLKKFQFNINLNKEFFDISLP